MSNPSHRDLESEKKLVNDPGWRYAVAMHTFLNRMYRGLSKEQRYAMYREAGIYKSLEGARKRAEVKGNAKP
jgi:hypothetical protein